MGRINESIFRAYDIRGIYGKDIDEGIAELVGKAFGTFIGNEGTVLVGHDVRISGPSLASAASKGLASVGVSVKEVGTVPTPALYLEVIRKGVAGGIQVTASHNPAEWNGFKLVLHNGDTVSEGMGMERVKKMIMEQYFREPPSPATITKEDVLKDYEEFILGKFEEGIGLKVAIDCSNGAACIIAPKLFRKVGCEVEVINGEPDGRFPAHEPEPTEETLRELMDVVVKTGSDFGVGFDGDADRCVFVDDKGRLVEGDIALAVFVKNLGIKGNVVYDVISSSSVRRTIVESGCNPVECRVGRAFMLRKVREVKAVIGGEKSNHLYFSDVYGFDDAIFASLKMAYMLSKTGKRLSEAIDEIPKYPSTPVITYDCPDPIKFKVIEELTEELRGEGFEVNTLDGVKATSEEGWFLIRASNTMPQVKLVAEAYTNDCLKDLVKYAEKKIKSVINRLSV